MMRRMARLWERHDEWRAMMDAVSGGASFVAGPRSIEAAGTAIRGYLEKLEFHDGEFSAGGWALCNGAPLRSVRVVLANGSKSAKFEAVVGIQREDVIDALKLKEFVAPGFLLSSSEPIPLSGEVLVDLKFSDGTSASLNVGPFSLTSGYGGWFKRLTQFVGFYVTEVIPRWPMFLRSTTRVTARKEITQKLDTEQFFAGHRLTVDGRSFLQGKASFDPLPEGVDIIIPVYNGFELLAELFRRLASHTTSPHRLIVIDDASTDPRVAEFLRDLRPGSKHCESIDLIVNETNLGFVKSVNRGLRASSRHAVLLNTDVKVPAKWLERLMRPIVLDKKVATTTPFTNSGTICSFPHFCRDNEMLLGLSVDVIDAHFRSVVPSDFPVVMPTGIGFCMGMSRRFIDQLGEFDEKTFGRGYGEENDWCCRAAAMGGLNIMVENLFVEHDHGGSFTSAEKKRLVEENLDRLAKKHPTYFKRVSHFISHDPAGGLRALLVAKIAARHSRARFDIIIDHDMGGGANIFRENRIKAYIREKRAFALIVPNGHSGRYEFRAYCGDQFHSFHFENWHTLNAILPKPGKRHPTTWVVNNLVGFTNIPAILEFLIARKERYSNAIEVLVHDYLPVCPSYNLLDKQGKYCGVPALPKCRACLVENSFALPTMKAVGVEEWRAIWRRLLEAADKVVHFSEASREVVLKAHPDLANKMIVRPHTVGWAVRRKLDVFPMRAEEPIRIGVVGAIGYPKGADMVIEAANFIARRNLNAEIVVVGRLSRAVNLNKLKILGTYKTHELPKLIERERIHVFWISSIWPETFSYVTTELMRLEVPIACFDLGAPRERLANYRLGAIIRKVSPKTAVKDLIALAHKANGLALQQRSPARRPSGGKDEGRQEQEINGVSAHPVA